MISVCELAVNRLNLYFSSDALLAISLLLSTNHRDQVLLDLSISVAVGMVRGIGAIARVHVWHYSSISIMFK